MIIEACDKFSNITDPSDSLSKPAVRLIVVAIRRAPADAVSFSQCAS
jgi:hypothetical protein